MKLLASSLLLAAIAASVVSAEKDDTYYVNGMENPNVEDKMYWNDGINVLEDLSQFEALYVTYHNCAWETPTGDDEDGGGGGDGDDWYLGSVPSFRANVGFSLYGKLKSGGHKGCNKKTFINSFHTTQGVESFTNAMAAAGLTDLFNYVDEDGGGEEGNGVDITSTCYENEEGGDGDDYYYNGDKMYGGTSYGLGCSADGEKTFAIHTYEGSYCDANAMTSTLDSLEEFNEKLAQSKCVPIYQEGDHYSADDDENVSPLGLLQTSKACRVHDGTGSCPDPYHRLRYYESELLKATGAIANVAWVNQYRMMVISYTMIAVGGVLIMAAIAMLSMECTSDSSNKKRRRKKKSRKYKMSSKKSKTSRDERDDYDGPEGGVIVKKNSSYQEENTQGSDAEGTGDDQSVEMKYGSDPPGDAVVRAKSEEPLSEDEPMSEEEGNNNNDDDDDDNKSKTSKQSDAKSTSSLNAMVNFVSEKVSEVFNDEAEEEEDDPKSLTHKLPSQRRPDETEVDSQDWTAKEEAASKKKYRKKRWFNKLLTNKKDTGTVKTHPSWN